MKHKMMHLEAKKQKLRELMKMMDDHIKSGIKTKRSNAMSSPIDPTMHDDETDPEKLSMDQSMPEEMDDMSEDQHDERNGLTDHSIEYSKKSPFKRR